jgi:DNA polymerase III sliding clamp (beta) subunit (PCNA family)
MPTTILFDTATLADAVSKASRVAPTKGKAFDRSAGLLFEVNPDTLEVVLKATNEDVTYRQTLHANSGTGDVATWRIPSSMLTSIITSLPMGSGSMVTLIDRGDQAIRLTCGRVKVRLATLNTEGFPRIEESDPSGMRPANEMAAKVVQVAWSVGKQEGHPLSGVHLDGKRLIGCDGTTVATVPCDVPLDDPVTVPLWLLAPLLKQASDIKVKASDKKLHIMLDAETATTSALLEAKYPNVDGVMRTDFTGSLEVNKSVFMDSLNRMLGLGKEDRVVSVRVEVNGTGLLKMVTFDMEIEGVGRMMDSIDVTTDYADIFEILFNPQTLQKAVDACRGDMVTIEFGHPDASKAARKPIKVTDKFGYICYVMPKNK